MLDPSQLTRFEEQGFLLARGLLDPKAELAALLVAYQDLIETLALIHIAEADDRPPADFRNRPLGERFALMLGASGGHVVEHLDPVISAFFRYLPRGQTAGRPYLPSVLVRSRSQPERELRNPLLWSAIWQRALDHLERPGSPVRRLTKLARAQAITAEWRRRYPDEAAWLRLVPGGGTGVRAAVRRGVRQLERALRRGGAESPRTGPEPGPR